LLFYSWFLGSCPVDVTIYHLPFTIYHLPCTTYHLPFTIHHLPFTTYHLPFTICHLPFTIYHLPFTIYHLPFTIYHLPFTFYLLPFTIYHLSSTIYHLRSTIYHLPLTFYHLPFTVYYLPFTIYHLPFTIHFIFSLQQQALESSNTYVSTCLQVARRKFVWKVGVWWAIGFLCEALAFATGAYANSELFYYRFSAAMLVAAACSFHVPVLGTNFKSLYKNYMITWVAIDAANQSIQRRQREHGHPRRAYRSSPNIASAGEDDSPGHIALANLGPSTSRPTNVAFARPTARSYPPRRQQSVRTFQQERSSDFFRVHLQLALVTGATSTHASLLLAPAANALLKAFEAKGGAAAQAQDLAILRVSFLCIVVAAWAMAVCVRWNVIYGVSAFCVLLSLPVGTGLLSILDAGKGVKDTAEPLWAVLSRSPGLLVGVVGVAAGALAVLAVLDFLVQTILGLVAPEGDHTRLVLGNSGYLGSEALDEPLAGTTGSEQLLAGRQANSLQSVEMNALDDDSELEGS
jgi:hypothetical protein